MKKALVIILIIILSAGAGWLFLKYSGWRSVGGFSLYTNPCKTINYKIVRVDDEFGINKDEFSARVKEATRKWEDKVNVDLFKSTEKADFSINLVYDSELSKHTGSTDDSAKSELRALQEKIRTLSKRYDRVKKEHDRLANKYETERQEYNRKVEYWSNQEGVPEGEYKKLQAQKKSLDDLKKRIDAKKQQSQQLIKQANELKKELSKIEKQKGEDSTTFIQKFGSSEKFADQSTKDGKLNIYSFRDRQTLQLILMHQLGHALGLKHADGNKKSIMHPQKAEQNLADPQLTQEDVNLLEKSCKREFKLSFL